MNMTFGRKIGAAFAVTAILSLSIGLLAISSLRSVVRGKDEVITITAQNLIDVQRLQVTAARKSSAVRGYLLAKEVRHLERANQEHRAFVDLVPIVRERLNDAEMTRLLDDATRAESEHDDACHRVEAMRRDDASRDGIARAFDEQVQPKSDELSRSLDAFAARGQSRLTDDTRDQTASAAAAENLILAIYGVVMFLTITLSVLLTRALGKQIGTAVGQVRSSSTELQTAANQQATSSKEQATAMSEITMTITELLATSRQIAESARRVAEIAEDTAGAARDGDVMIDRAHESIATIRRQVDLIVNHMLELGKKSQHIGTVLDIVAELAEQTNILAINATIEASGAGEAGLRFAVVAGEIRKLADRMANSTKEIRGLIEDVRGSVNATVMTTETGSKAVDAGAKLFSDVAAGFKRIAGMVVTTTDASREIELSTKQQSTAVEQVNVAMMNVAQASRETEASAGQTLQTARHLNGLSVDLLRIVEPQHAA